MKTLALSMISIAATLAAMTACTSENSEIDNVIDDAKVPVNFGQSIGIFSKAIVTGEKLSNTTIGIWGQEYTESAAWKAGNFMDNLSLSVDGSGAITYTTTGEAKYYSIVADTKYDFYAYSPIAAAGNGLTVTAATESTAPSIGVTLATTAGAQTDIMTANAKTVTKSANAVALTFSHALAQIKFQIQKATGVTAGTLSAIKVNANSVATMDLSGAFSSKGTLADFKVLEGGSISITNSYADAGSPILLFPEALGSNSVTFTIDGKDYSFTPTATLTAGKVTTIKVEISASGVNFTQSVTDWSDEADGSGTIE